MSSAGAEAVELARMAGLVLDPWQEFVLAHSLGERADGKWAALEVGLMVSRQNGKGSILEARELAGLFLLGERFITHSAHQFDTSLEAFRRLLTLIEETPDFERRVKRVSRSHGEEGIELKNRQRIRFRTRTKGGGRGFTGDCLILDEAMFLPEAAHGALFPTLSARPNPQIWYTGSAVDQEEHHDGIVFARIRGRGHAGDDPALAYFEWSLDLENPEKVDDDVALDPEAWAAANPGLGIRISPEFVANERRSMDHRTFAVERLGVGDWPDPDGDEALVDLGSWDALADEDSDTTGTPCWSADVRPNRSSAAIGVAARRPDGLPYVDVADHRPGTGWVVARVAELVEKHGGRVMVDDAGPAGGLLVELQNKGVAVETVNAREYGQACGLFVDSVENAALRHSGDPGMRAAIKGAAKRSLGDAWAWARKSSSVDISPLVACTLALWAAAGTGTGGGFEW